MFKQTQLDFKELCQNVLWIRRCLTNAIERFNKLPTQADLDAATQAVTAALSNTSATILSTVQGLEAKINAAGTAIDATTDIAALKAAADGLSSLGSQVQAIANPSTSTPIGAGTGTSVDSPQAPPISTSGGTVIAPTSSVPGTPPGTTTGNTANPPQTATGV